VDSAAVFHGARFISRRSAVSSGAVGSDDEDLKASPSNGRDFCVTFDLSPTKPYGEWIAPRRIEATFDCERMPPKSGPCSCGRGNEHTGPSKEAPALITLFSDGHPVGEALRARSLGTCGDRHQSFDRSGPSR
jgi:hypothetical protein